MEPNESDIKTIQGILLAVAKPELAIMVWSMWEKTRPSQAQTTYGCLESWDR